jgi:hypothetical protein
MQIDSSDTFISCSLLGSKGKVYTGGVRRFPTYDSTQKAESMHLRDNNL